MQLGLIGNCGGAVYMRDALVRFLHERTSCTGSDTQRAPDWSSFQGRFRRRAGYKCCSLRSIKFILILFNFRCV
jgi:hypothetical protein